VVAQLFMSHPGPLADLPQPELPDGFTFRPATLDDADELAELVTAAYDPVHDTPWDGERMRTELLEYPDVLRTWVVVDDQGRIHATASERLLPYIYPEGTGYVHFVGTLSSSQGLGLGKAITLRVLHGFAERGMTKAVLNTADFRLPAVRLYLQLGFLPEYREDSERAAWSALFRYSLMAAGHSTRTGGAQ
jgi:mycothiol synthase